MYKTYQEFNDTKCKCRDCPIGLVYNKVVCSIGNLTNPIYMLIGEAPGETEIEKGQPFCGRSGKLLREMLVKYGLTMSNTVITNTIPCRPENNIFPSDIKLVANCMNKWLLEEINLLKPKYILLIGSTAMKHVLGCDKPISEIRGQWFSDLTSIAPEGSETFDEKYNKSIQTMVTFHPSYLIRQGNTPKGDFLREQFEQDIKNFKLNLNKTKGNQC